MEAIYLFLFFFFCDRNDTALLSIYLSVREIMKIYIYDTIANDDRLFHSHRQKADYGS